MNNMGEFSDAMSLAVLNTGSRKDNIDSCTIYTISHRDKFLYAIDIKYMDGKTEKYKIGQIGRTIQHRIEQKDGMITDSGIFPIDASTSREDITTWTFVIPYIEISTGITKPATLELKKQDIKFGGGGAFGNAVVDSYPLLEFTYDHSR
jgi:hypothetical protein